MDCHLRTFWVEESSILKRKTKANTVLQISFVGTLGISDLCQSEAVLESGSSTTQLVLTLKIYLTPIQNYWFYHRKVGLLIQNHIYWVLIMSAIILSAFHVLTYLILKQLNEFDIIIIIYLLLFSYSCPAFFFAIAHPYSVPSNSHTQSFPIVCAKSPLFVSLCLPLPLLSAVSPLPPPLWSLSVRFLLPSFWFYFVHLFVSLIWFHL